MEEEKVKKLVRQNYGAIAKNNRSCCNSIDTSSCQEEAQEKISKEIGYSEEEINKVPEGSNLGLGCGNPVALASLKEGETVLDLGSGAGFDCFLAAEKVGQNGKVIGIDMTAEMIEKARENANKSNYGNVEFRLGEIEAMPVADSSVDIIISNCVINLSPEKKKVFSEAYRVIKPGGRMMISDIVLLKELPAQILESVEAYIGCVSGAILKDNYLKIIEEAGFKDVKIINESKMDKDLILNDEITKKILDEITENISLKEIEKSSQIIASVQVEAFK